MPSSQHSIPFSRRKIMAVCMEHIICDTLIDLLMFDFLTAIRKLRHILYCNVRVLL